MSCRPSLHFILSGQGLSLSLELSGWLVVPAILLTPPITSQCWVPGLSQPRLAQGMGSVDSNACALYPLNHLNSPTLFLAA